MKTAKSLNRMHGAAKLVAGLGLAGSCVCMVMLGWWVAPVFCAVAGWKLGTGLVQVVTGWDVAK